MKRKPHDRIGSTALTCALPTIQDLYLTPLQIAAQANNGGIYTDATPLTLLVDN